MALKNETVNFDGKQIGIIVQITNANGTKPKFITLEGRPRLFNNLEVAKIMAPVIVDEGEFDYWILYDNNMSNIININSCKQDKRRHVYQYIDINNGVVYNFVEKRTHKLSNFGYLVFDNGDKVRTEKSIGIKRQIELLNMIKEISSYLLSEKWDDYGISLIETKYKEIVIHIKSTTTKIHIVFNSRLMDINQRKSEVEGTKRIPFLKNMDKFVTFYIFASKDVGEGKRIGGEDKARYIIDNIVNDLSKYYPEANPKLERIDFNGFIDLED